MRVNPIALIAVVLSLPALAADVAAAPGTVPSPQVKSASPRAGAPEPRLDTNKTFNRLQATYIAVGDGKPPAEDQLPATLSLLGPTAWGLEADEAPALQIIDRTNNIRRGIFDTSGDVFLGGSIGCVGGCSAGLSYKAATSTTVAAGKVSSQNGLVQHDTALFQPSGNTDGSPVHFKSNLAPGQVTAFHVSVQGYNWGSQTEIDSVCVGSFANNTLTGPGCTDKTPGVAASVYLSSDGFLVVKVTSPTIAQAGFTLSAAYFYGFPQNTYLDVNYQVLRSATDL